MQLSSDQEDALEYIAKWRIGAPSPERGVDKRGKSITIGLCPDYPVCSVGGYAGTGKTTILRYVAEASPSAVLVTPTHKAAQVLRRKLPGALANRVQTFHSLIYTPDPDFTCGLTGQKIEIVNCGCPEDTCDCELTLSPCSTHLTIDDCEPAEHLKFQKRPNIAGYHDLIIVDESSMLTEREVNDLRSYGLPVLLVGDHGQLPPVKAKMNPWILNPQRELTVNHRQGEQSGIPEAADEARAYGALRKQAYGTSVRVLPAKDPLVDNLLRRYQPDADTSTVIVQYNRTRAALNSFFRRDATAKVIPGERLIALERMEDVGVVDDAGQVINETVITSGTLATVKQVISEGPKHCLVTAKLDCDFFGGTCTTVLLRLATEQLGKAEQLGYKFKPGGSQLWDYAYVLTAHKAQGSEFSRVLVFQETPGDKRWLYTSLTRARDALIVITL